LFWRQRFDRYRSWRRWHNYSDNERRRTFPDPPANGYAKPKANPASAPNPSAAPESGALRRTALVTVLLLFSGPDGASAAFRLKRLCLPFLGAPAQYSWL